MHFTILIPTYNRAHTILRTINSLIIQDFKNFEVIIVDDGSTDNTEELISKVILKNSINLKYIKRKNGGKHTAINIGIENANGIFFMILDSDDYLEHSALSRLYQKSLLIINDDTFSGVMGRCVNIIDDKIIGKIFPSEPYISSYVDFHFISGRKIGPFGDCCEINKTNIIKQYRYPENEMTKFVPEAYIFDQIGTKYKLLCTNEIFEYKEYLSTGISNDKKYKIKNNIGFLYHYISRIENVMNKVDNFPYLFKIISWWRYWESVKQDNLNIGPRLNKISFTGKIVKIAQPIITLIYRVRHKKLYESGR
jgi:glycosyltransferase involved in cell wall biosynthesis